MRNTRRMASFFIILLLGTLGAINPGQGDCGNPKLTQVVYLTTSKACGCLLETCKAGDKVMAEVFVDARLPLLERVDMARDRGTFSHYMKEYRLVTIPAVIFLDQEGNLLWSAVGPLHKDDIIAKLKQFGT